MKKVIKEVKTKKYTKKELKELAALEREEFLRNNRHGIFGSIF